jgi:hypothetical protein
MKNIAINPNSVEFRLVAKSNADWFMEYMNKNKISLNHRFRYFDYTHAEHFGILLQTVLDKLLKTDFSFQRFVKEELQTMDGCKYLILDFLLAIAEPFADELAEETRITANQIN